MTCKCGSPVHWITYSMCGNCVRAAIAIETEGGDAQQAPSRSDESAAIAQSIAARATLDPTGEKA